MGISRGLPVGKTGSVCCPWEWRVGGYFPRATPDTGFSCTVSFGFSERLLVVLVLFVWFFIVILNRKNAKKNKLRSDLSTLKREELVVS